MIRGLRFCCRALGWAALGLLLLLAVGSTVLRYWLLPRIDTWRPRIGAEVSALLGEPVGIERVSAQVHGLWPAIRLGGISIGAAPHVVRLDAVTASLDLRRSLLAMRPVLGRLGVTGAWLQIARQADGSWGLVGFNGTGEAPDWLFRDGEIELTDCTVEVLGLAKSQKPVGLSGIDVRLENRGTWHRGSLRAGGRLGRSPGRFSLTFAGEAGSKDPASWRGDWYLRAADVNLGLIDKLLIGGETSAADETVTTQVWGHWAGGEQRLLGDLTLARPVVGKASETWGGRFAARQGPRGTRIDVRDWRRGARVVGAGSDLAVEWAAESDPQISQWRVATEFFDLAEAGALARLMPPGAARTEWLALSPGGTLHDVKAELTLRGRDPLHWAVCGQVRDFAVPARGGRPGISGLGVQGCATDAGGHAALRVERGQFDPPELGLRRPISLVFASADLDWRREADSWRVWSPSVVARNGELDAAARVEAMFPGNGADPLLDVGLTLGPTTVAVITNYLPTALFPVTARWLDRALGQGDIQSINLIMRGRSAEFPFAKSEGAFALDIEADRVDLRFSPEWEPLTDARMDLAFRADRLFVDVPRGRVGEGLARDAHATIDHLGGDALLRLNGRIEADFSASLQYLVRSPLKRTPARILDLADLSGQTHIDLQLQLPLEGPDVGPRLKVAADLRDAAIKARGWPLTLEHIGGLLHFDENGLLDSDLTATWLGEPLAAHLAPRGDSLVVKAAGKLASAALAEAIPNPSWRWFQGRTDVQYGLTIPQSLDAQSAPLRLELTSDLRGIGLSLPAPLGKTAEASRRLRLEASFQNGHATPVKLSYGDNLAARLRLVPGTDGQLQAKGGEIAIGEPLPAIDSAPGWLLRARLERLDLAAWSDWLDEVRQPATAASHVEDSDTSDWSMRELSLNVDAARWRGLGLGRLNVQADPIPDGWFCRVAGDFAQGSVDLKPTAIQVRLNHLHVPVPPDPPVQAAEPMSTAALTAVDPARLPPISLTASQVWWRRADLGKLTLLTEQRPRGMVVRELSLASANHAADFQGEWSRQRPAGTATSLEGELRSRDLGLTLAAFGHPGEVRGTASLAKLKLRWPGGPQDFSKASLAGDLDLKLEEGALLKFEPGLGRVLGMLDFGTIWRRLSFDFSDLFGQGLAYDGVTGTFRFADGQATTDGLLIDAVPARILITGRAGLVARDLDETVTVIPRTTVALPVAGALAGGPAVGAAVLVAQQLVGEEVDKITATRYAVTGPWSEPKLTELDRNLPLEMLGRAWKGVKEISGLGGKPEEKHE